MEDGQIVELYLRRDESAVVCTAEKYGPRLRAFAQNIVEDARTAEECENDAYWEAWNAIPPHEPRDYLYPFLARITRHIALNRCREREQLKRKARLTELSQELEQCIPAPGGVEEHMDALELSEAVNGFLAGLSAEKRSIFLRRYWYLDSVADIADRFGLSRSKVKTTLFRLRGSLRDYLIKEGHTL